MTTTTAGPASDKQTGFINKLISEREMPAATHKEIDRLVANGLTKTEASTLIKTLLGMPKAQAAAITEPGIYETADGAIYIAKTNKSKTNLYAKRLIETAERVTEAGAVIEIDFLYEAGAIYKLDPGMKMDAAKAQALTVKYGRCLICGRRLKAAKSVIAGIGPVCAKYYGGGF